MLRIDVCRWAIFLVWIFLRSLSIICYNKWVLGENEKKILRGSLSNELKACLSDLYFFCLDQIAILSNVCTPDKFESHYSPKHNLINVRGLCSNFVGWESFLESSTSNILALCETNLEDANDYSNFSVRSYLPLIWKDSITHMQGLAVYQKKRLSFAWHLSLAKLEDSYDLDQLYCHSVTYFIFLYESPLPSLCKVFDTSSSKTDEIFSINKSANTFLFVDFNVHHKDWLTYFGGTDRPGELSYIFSISNDLTQMIPFLLGSLTATLTVLLFWIYFLFSSYMFYSSIPSIGTFWSGCLSFQWLSLKLKKRCPFASYWIAFLF